MAKSATLSSAYQYQANPSATLSVAYQYQATPTATLAVGYLYQKGDFIKDGFLYIKSSRPKFFTYLIE